jgi:hypothetical protein
MSVRAWLEMAPEWEVEEEGDDTEEGLSNQATEEEGKEEN